MIITEKTKLQTLCESVSSVEEGEEIAANLFNQLTESENGIGLAANQIGINKRVCVINVKEPLYLINPSIVNKSSKTFLSREDVYHFQINIH